MKLNLPLAIALLASASLHPASAATRTWQQPVSGNFSGEGNQWNTVPATGDIAMFTGYAPTSVFEVTLTENITNSYLRVSGGNPFQVTFNLAGYSYTATGSPDSTGLDNTPSLIGRDNGDNVTLILTGGGLFDAAGITVGNAAGSTGSLILTGGTNLSTSQEGYFGNSGSASFTISGGSTYTSNEDSRIARNTGGNATISVTGASSKWISNKEIFVGSGASSTTTLSLSGGGVLETTAETTNGAINLGINATSTVNVTITGSGSTLNGRNVNIGGSRSAVGGAAAVLLEDQGLLKARTTLNLDSKGILTLAGGTVEARDFGSDTRGVTGTLNYTLGSGSDVAAIKVTNDVFLNGAKLNLTLAPGIEYETDAVIRLLEYRGSLSGTFEGYSEGQTVVLGSQSFLFSYEMQGQGTARVIGLTAIPEPGSAALALTGIAATIVLWGCRGGIKRGGRAE